MWAKGIGMIEQEGQMCWTHFHVAKLHDSPMQCVIDALLIDGKLISGTKWFSIQKYTA